MPQQQTLPDVDIDSPYPLSREQVERFRRDGFIKLKSFFSAEALAAYDPAITRNTLEKNSLRDKPMEKRSTYDKAFIQVSNIWETDETVKRFAFGKRAARAAAELLGVESVRMWHDQALYKEASGGFTPWHADQQYWPFDSEKCVTIWIPLQAVPIEMGPLSFARGSHLKKIGRDLVISDESEKLIADGVKREGLDEVYEPFELGEVSYHYGWTLHRAGPNSTPQARKVFTVIYMDAHMRLQPRTPVHRSDWERWTPGTHVGRVMDDPRNPVLYP
ncbi:MAG: phytanoyl-CoA dioxygenase [Phycisphaera sp.]|nr:phytanoyl-CoA dioxygenase [Phycisphaera sp.]